MAKHQAALGIEVLGGEVRLALVEADDGGIVLRHTRTVRAGEDYNRAIRSLPRRPASVVGAVSLRQGAIRVLSLPPTSEENLQRVVQLEAEAAVPLPAEEIALAHHSLGMTEQSRTEVLVAAAMTDDVQHTLRRANFASWVTAEVTLTAISLLNTLQVLKPEGFEGACAVLRIEDYESELVIFDKGRIALTRFLPVGCKGKTPNSALNGAAHPPDAEVQFDWLAELAGQARYGIQSIAYERGLELARLYICGRGSAESGIDWRLSEALNLQVRGLVPTGLTTADAGIYTVAFGCAIQAAGAAGVSLNLVPTKVVVAREREQRRQHRFSSNALIFGASAALLLVLLAVTNKRKDELRVLTEQAKLLGSAPRGNTVPPSLLAKAAEALATQQANRAPAGGTLAAFNAVMPQGAWLSQWTYSAQTGSVLRGYALDPVAANKVQIELLRLKLYDEVTLDFSQEEKVGETAAWAFQISCKLRPKLKTRGSRSTTR